VRPDRQLLKSDLVRERERHFSTARAVQIPEHGQIRTKSRQFLSPLRRLRSSAIIWKQLSLQSSAIYHLRSSVITWKPALKGTLRNRRAG